MTPLRQNSRPMATPPPLHDHRSDVCTVMDEPSDTPPENLPSPDSFVHCMVLPHVLAKRSSLTLPLSVIIPLKLPFLSHLRSEYGPLPVDW
jgi:hypothetical protein